MRRTLAREVGREDRRVVRRELRALDLGDQCRDVGSAHQAGGPAERRGGAQHDGVLRIETRHRVAVGVHPAALRGEEAVVGDEVDA